MATISDLLTKALGEKPSERERAKPDFDTLPKSLRDLARTISESTRVSAKAAKDEQSASERRQKAADSLQRRFMADLEELSKVTALLNSAQRTAARRSEERAKRTELAQKRADERNSRATKENGVKHRLNSESQANWMGLIGAVGGKGFQGLVDNFVRAGAQTRKDVAEIASARYSEEVSRIDTAKEDALADIDSRREEHVGKVATTYARGIEKRLPSEGANLQEVAAASKVLDSVEKAAEALKKATVEKERIEKEGAARIAEAEFGVVHGREPQGTVAQAGAPVASGQGVILDASGQPAPARQDIARIAAIRKEVAAANMAAEADVSEKRDAYMKAREGVKTAPSAVAGGELAGAEQEKAAAALTAAANNAISMIEERADSDRSRAIDAAANAKILATKERDSGNLVSSAEKASVRTSNILNTAIAPPAVVAIAKAMDEFKKLFPVVGQAGSAVVELSAVLPAVLTGGLFKAGSMVLGGLNSLKEALPGGQSDVSKRYEKANARFLEDANMTRGEAYGKAYSLNVAEARKRTTDIPLGMRGMAVAPSIVRANAPHEYTSADVYESAAGATHLATTRAEVSAPPPPPQPPQRYEQSIGVVPVGASNRSIDEWR